MNVSPIGFTPAMAHVMDDDVTLAEKTLTDGDSTFHKVVFYNILCIEGLAIADLGHICIVQYLAWQRRNRFYSCNLGI